jgi:hypothetical protein
MIFRQAARCMAVNRMFAFRPETRPTAAAIARLHRTSKQTQDSPISEIFDFSLDYLGQLADN